MVSYLTLIVVILFAILLLTVINVLRDPAASRSRVKTMLILNSLTFPVLALVAVLVLSIPALGLAASAMMGSSFFDQMFGVIILWPIFTVAFLVTEVILIGKFRKLSQQL